MIGVIALNVCQLDFGRDQMIVMLYGKAKTQVAERPNVHYIDKIFHVKIFGGILWTK